MKNGILYGIGVGPGDPELMTLKSVRLIEESDILFLPAKSREKCMAYRIAAQAVGHLAEKEYLCHEFPMVPDKEIMDQAHDEITKLLAEELVQGKTVAFLTIGDPSIYSTYSYIQERLVADGYEVKTVSGVPSFCAVAARLGIPLGLWAEEIHILSGYHKLSEQKSPLNEVLKQEYKGTRIYMKSGRQLETLLHHLQVEMRCQEIQVYIITNCGLENETMMIIGPDTEIDVSDYRYMTTVIVTDKRL
ncbi:MAG: precorrin-2 C(20)-methyltransferase [Lachnospiraceae bacterium]|nr:precorrin-2 C(20)-methyltransferase [Lachnospiraceae bacterium]MBR1568819.1 precorrin-2 C(20)-methyltransferase [Lachnospiraceae bacterium]